MKRLLLALLLAACSSCDGDDDVAPSPSSIDGSVTVEPVDLSVPDHHEGGEGDGGTNVSDAAPMVPTVIDGGAFQPPTGGGDTPMVHAPATTITSIHLLAGQDVLDVSVDQGGGVWAATNTTIYYLVGGKTYTYDQKSGLARGQYTWTDTWFAPGTYPVTFTSVGAGPAGNVMVGNFGAIADRLVVNPANGAVLRIDNLQVTSSQVQGAELPEHIKRVVSVWKSVVDVNGAYSGTAYLGGFHGFYAFHGINQDCGCLAFEEHQHYFSATDIGGADVKGLAISSQGDLFQGDRDFVTMLPQRSKGANTGLFDYDFGWGYDVFPGVRDEVIALAADASDGVWVASDGNGLAYLAPATQAASYWSSATRLPQNHLRAVAVDGGGDVWIGTQGAGVARLKPSTGTWTYYTAASGLPSDGIRSIYFDKLTAGKKIYIATSNGIAVVTP